MIILEFGNENGFIQELEKEFGITRVVLESFGMETIIQLVIPLAAILAPVVSPIIIKALESNQVTIKYDGVEYTGSIKNIQKAIREVQQLKQQRDSE